MRVEDEPGPADVDSAIEWTGRVIVYRAPRLVVEGRWRGCLSDEGGRSPVKIAFLVEGSLAEGNCVGGLCPVES